MYNSWGVGANPVDTEYIISDVEICEGHVAFNDYTGKRHCVKLKTDKLRRAYIVYKNKHIYFNEYQINGMYTVTPAYRNGNKIISAGLDEYDYNTDRIHFYMI